MSAKLPDGFYPFIDERFPLAEMAMVEALAVSEFKRFAQKVWPPEESASCSVTKNTTLRSREI